jgi:hypothetical protein
VKALLPGSSKSSPKGLAATISKLKSHANKIEKSSTPKPNKITFKAAGDKITSAVKLADVSSTPEGSVFSAFGEEKRSDADFALQHSLPRIHSVTREFCGRPVSEPQLKVVEEKRRGTVFRKRGVSLSELGGQVRVERKPEFVEACRFLDLCVELSSHLESCLRTASDDLTLEARVNGPPDGAAVVARLAQQVTDTSHLEAELLRETRRVLDNEGTLDACTSKHDSLQEEYEENLRYVAETSKQLEVSERIVQRQHVQMTESDSRLLELGTMLSNLHTNLEYAKTFEKLRIEDGPALRRSIFLLERQNQGAMSTISLARRKVRGWHARAAVLQATLTKQYMGSIDSSLTKDTREVLADTLADDLRRPETNDKAVREFLKRSLRLSVKPPVVKVDLYQPRCLITETIKETELVQEEVDFLTHLMATYGEAVFEFLGSDVAWSPHIRSRCLEILGREFYHQSVYVDRMNELLMAKESVVQCKRSEDLLINMSSFTKKLLGCSDAKLWIVHKERKIIWHLDEKIDGNTADVDLPSAKAVRHYRDERKRGETEGIGLLQGAYVSAEEMNVDPFNSHFASEKDLKVSKGTYTLLIPILKKSRDKDLPEVLAIAEAHCKDIGGKFSKDDCDILRLFASTCFEVFQICEEDDGMAWDETRGQTVMGLAEALMSVHTPELRDPMAPNVMKLLQTGFQELFNADMVSLHVVFSGFLGKLTAGDAESPYSLDALEHVPMEGLVGWCVRHKKAISSTSANEELAHHVGLRQAPLTGDRELDKKLAETGRNQSVEAHALELHEPWKHSAAVDLPWGEQPSDIHTWPCFSGKVLSCVLQFRCKEPAGRPFGDDGAFNEYSTYHHRILQQLIVCVMLHMNDRYPMTDRELIESNSGKLVWAEGKSPSKRTGDQARRDG